ncbi:MAG: hypothetical protein QOI76_4254, partial [Frankiales bacterium]|nr:hypothetical protein [Frankiales bacterium]
LRVCLFDGGVTSFPFGGFSAGLNRWRAEAYGKQGRKRPEYDVRLCAQVPGGLARTR